MVEFTKLTAFGNFPHMFLQTKIHAQNIFENGIVLFELMGR